METVSTASAKLLELICLQKTHALAARRTHIVEAMMRVRDHVKHAPLARRAVSKLLCVPVQPRLHVHFKLVQYLASLAASNVTMTNTMTAQG